MVKINEVAKAAGVSISTVSYALSGKRPVSEKTRRRIEAAVADLDYRPNAGARMLAGRRTHIFALTEPLRPDTYAPTHMAFVLAASVAARRKDYDILLLTDEEASVGMRRVAESGLVDAILVLDVAPTDERVELARQLGTPAVFIGVPDDREGLVCVDLDFSAAAELAVDRLADAGHARVGLIGQPPESYRLSNFPPRVRDGFLRRAEERRLPSSFRMPDGPGTPAERTRRAVSDMVDDGVTGLVLQCSEEAHVAVLDELQRRGLRVPDDVSLISVGSTFDTSAFSVPVSAVPLIPAESCDLAVELAARAATEGGVEPAVHLIAPIFRDLGSVASPTGLFAAPVIASGAAPVIPIAEAPSAPNFVPPAAL